MEQEINVYKNEFDVLEKTHEELLKTLNALSEKEGVSFEEKKYYIRKMIEVNNQIDERRIKLAKIKRQSIRSGVISLFIVSSTVLGVMAFNLAKSQEK